MNGKLISTNDDISEENDDSGDALQELAEDMATLGIADRDAEDVVQSDHVYKTSIFEISKTSKFDSHSTSKLGSHPTSLVTSPDVSAPDSGHQTIRPSRVYGPKAHFRIVFKERGQSLHSLSRL